jgi:hypothetical protein
MNNTTFPTIYVERNLLHSLSVRKKFVIFGFPEKVKKIEVVFSELPKRQKKIK